MFKRVKKPKKTKISAKAKKAAEKIIELENKAKEDSDFNYEEEMMKVVDAYNLSLEDFLAIDVYIIENNFLTK